MNLDLHVWRFDWALAGGIARGFSDLARRSERLGVRTLSVMDHYFQMESQAPATDPMLEGYTALAFIAGVTSRIRLRTLVTGVTYRHPGVLAKTVTTLDVLSEGRAELGLGAAWYEREHRGLGIPFPPLSERFERLEETLEICLQLWSGKVGRYAGRHYELAETLCSPLPVSSPRPRILIGGGGERKTLRLVAKYADACNLFGGPAQVAHKLAVLRRHCDDRGARPERDRGDGDVSRAPARRSQRRSDSGCRGLCGRRCLDARDEQRRRRSGGLARVELRAVHGKARGDRAPVALVLPGARRRPARDLSIDGEADEDRLGFGDE